MERFKAVVHFEKPDYWALINVEGLDYIHAGGLRKLHREGLPASVNDLESWCRYWGQCTFDHGESIGEGAPGIRSERWLEGDFEFIRTETGALMRQVRDNDLACSMPEFIEFDARDRGDVPSGRRFPRQC